MAMEYKGVRIRVCVLQHQSVQTENTGARAINSVGRGRRPTLFIISHSRQEADAGPFLLQHAAKSNNGAMRNM